MTVVPKQQAYPTIAAGVHKDDDERNDGAEQTDDHAAPVHSEPDALPTDPVVGPHRLVVLGEDKGRTGAHHPANQHQAACSHEPIASLD